MTNFNHIETLAEAMSRIARLEKALAFYADRHIWVYSIDSCKLELTHGGGRLTVPYYPETKFPALEDHGDIARAALGKESSYEREVHKRKQLRGEWEEPQ
jgi:hypothetical protein